jgi:long-chain fatty acid transport protein
MKKTLSALILASLFIVGTVFASGYRIPEQSADSTAKAGAHVAAAIGADSVYYNPANMAWAYNAWQGEVDLTYLHLTSIEYRDSRSTRFNGDSEKENFLLPTLFILSPEVRKFRFGFSITEPYGLAKRWEDSYPKTFAQEFELKVIEFNPTVAYRFNDYISIGGGVRLLYNDATVKSSGVSPSGITAVRDLEGDTTEWGYNLALAVRPNQKSNISVTYRSNVDLDFSGDATLSTNFGPTTVHTGGLVTVPAPAVLAISGAYTFERLTVELTYDRTYWSEYETLAFIYDTPLTNPVLAQAFGTPSPKDWKDTNAFRIGLTYQLTTAVALMGGFAYDENPVPDHIMGFELPDSEAWLYSLGTRFSLNNNMGLSLGILYDYKEKRSVTNDVVDGTFKDASAFLLTTGFTYTF